MNWGRQTSHRLIPSMVVDLLLQNNIRQVKLTSPSDNVMKAFVGGEVEIAASIPNESVKYVKKPGTAAYWLRTKIYRHINSNVKVKYILVGHEPFSWYYRNHSHNVVDSLRYIRDALVRDGFGDTKVSIPHFTDVLLPGIKKPSEADFNPEVKNKIVESLHILNISDAPFFINIFPIHYISENNWDPEFAFLDNKSNFSIIDDINGLKYTNVFDFVYDSLLWAFKRYGFPNLKVVVGQIGWPTDGFLGANTINAERFYKSFLPAIAGNKGTPMRPGSSIDVYLQSLSDENLTPIHQGAFQRHWGIYGFDGEPKYKIDFMGQGRDIYPTTAKGVIRMPKRWCVFNGNSRNLTKLKIEFEYACVKADCTSLAPGGSCSHLDFQQNVSYAFNRYFQVEAQTVNGENACDFKGLGKVVVDDPSVGTCKFPVEILAAEQADGNCGGGRLHGRLFGSTVTLLSPLFFIVLLLALNWAHQRICC
ncbi:hypothetical protein ACJIZ3_002353 [Penstemon smallii]|uniref:X8 domain-containing protein n=1 Tax=Penstemon smallii TaxID=265156 RepID=A0ABD3U7J0_9LAMI